MTEPRIILAVDTIMQALSLLPNRHEALVVLGSVAELCKFPLVKMGASLDDQAAILRGSTP